MVSTKLWGLKITKKGRGETRVEGWVNRKELERDRQFSRQS